MSVLRPVHDRILVTRDDPETVTSGGIVMPSTSLDEKTSRATVVAVGPGKYSEKTGVLIPMTVKVGDRILCHPAAGSKVVVSDQVYWSLPESDVWCVIDPD